MDIIFCVCKKIRAFHQAPQLHHLRHSGSGYGSLKCRVVKHFLWHACPNLLPTKQNLKKRKILIGDGCDFCVGNQENMLHCLWDCEALRVVWDVNFSQIDWRKISSGSLIDLVEVISNKLNALENFAVTAWMLWRWRNKIHVNEKALPLDSLHSEACHYLREYNKFNTKHVFQSQENASSGNLLMWVATKQTLMGLFLQKLEKQVLVWSIEIPTMRSCPPYWEVFFSYE